MVVIEVVVLVDRVSTVSHLRSWLVADLHDGVDGFRCEM